PYLSIFFNEKKTPGLTHPLCKTQNGRAKPDVFVVNSQYTPILYFYAIGKAENMEIYLKNKIYPPGSFSA
ncbi:MAG: hypothetical protein ILP07_02020, partial [Treponema sp.]|nr:hypothetical protein [Treponema sp.]